MKERERHLPDSCLSTLLEHTNHDVSGCIRSFQPTLWLSLAVEIDYRGLSSWFVCSSDVYRHESGRCLYLSFILKYFHHLKYMRVTKYHSVPYWQKPWPELKMRDIQCHSDPYWQKPRPEFHMRVIQYQFRLLLTETTVRGQYEGYISFRPLLTKTMTKGQYENYKYNSDLYWQKPWPEVNMRYIQYHSGPYWQKPWPEKNMRDIQDSRT